MSKVLVTGGAGFIGSHLVEALVAAGHSVRVLDNLSTGTRRNLAAVEPHVEFQEGNVNDAEAVAAAVAGTETVFHQAALASVPLSLERPADVHAACASGTLNVLQQSRLAGVRRVIYAGSSSAYGDYGTGTNRERDPLEPLSPYAAAKLAGEHYCRAFHRSFGLETLTLRYFNVFGPRQDPNSPYSAVIPIFITRMLTGRAPIVNGDGGQSRDFTYVANVVDANLAAMTCEGANGQSVNVATGKSYSLLELIAAVNAELGTKIVPQHGPPRAGEVRDSMADISLARRVLGFEPRVSFHEGLKKTIEHYRAATLAAER